MADNKFYKSEDRNIILLDAKQRIIDLMANNQPLPSEGIYDEPVRYFKANEKWCAVIFGFLDWLEDVAGWPDAVDENYAGIQAILTFEEGIPPPTLPSEGNCTEYPNSAPFISYFPDSPFIAGDVQAGWITEAWVRFGEFDSIFPDWIDEWIQGQIEAFTGYQSTDILCNIASLPLNSIESFLENGGVLPKIEIRFSGTGIVELELLSFPLGGRAIIEVDEEPNILDILTGGILDPNAFIVELDRDLLSFPPEEYPVVNIEIPVATGGNHIIYIVFVPVVNDTLIPVGMGGGLRSVELCGFENEAVAMGIEDVRFNTETCTFEKRVGGVWGAIEGGEEWLMCVEGGGMAAKDDIRDGIYEAVNRLSAQIVSGGFTGFSVDEDGVVTVGSGAAGGELPEDDPATEFDETLAAKMGGTIAVLAAIEKYLDRIDNYYGATNNEPVTPAATTKAQLALLFPVDMALLDVAMADYYAYRVTENRITYDDSPTHQNYMFCKGSGLMAWNNLLVELSGFNAYKMATVAGLTNALAPEFWTSYFASGSELPSTQYYDAPCVPIAPQTLLSLVFGTSRATTPFKSQHRMKFKVKGYAQDTAGKIQDAFWYRTAEGVLSRSNWSWTHSSGTNLPSDNQVVYNDSHQYEYTIDLGTLNAAMVITPVRNGGMIEAGLLYPVPFEVTIEDLGEYTV